jgi:hypothetical protein
MRRKYLPLLLIPALLLLLLLVRSSTSHDNLILDVAPGAAKIVLDGDRSITSGSHSLSVGKHTIRASQAGFAAVEKAFSVSKGKVVTLDIVLNPNSEIGYAYLRNNPKEQLRRESLGGRSFDNESTKAGQKNPLIYELPFIDQLYRIDYGSSREHPGDPTATAIYITLYRTGAREDALDWIRFKGYDPSKLEIIYIVGESPSSAE